MSTEDREQLRRFRSLVASEAHRTTADGRPPFTLPLAECSRDESARRLDAISMATWLDRHGLHSEPLRWFVEYATRDDYGASLNATSAWAALHYFASRDSEERFEFPEGNGQIVYRLLQELSAEEQRPQFPTSSSGAGSSSSGAGEVEGWLRTGALVYSIEPTAGGAVAGVLVRYAQQPKPRPAPDTARPTERATGDLRSEALVRTLHARRVIYAAPLFTAAHIIRGWHATWLREFTYAPWVVANIHLRAPPADGPARCDNVIYRAPGLGYTLSIHPPSSWLTAAARVRSRLGGGGTRSTTSSRGSGGGGGAVLTYYKALASEPPETARVRMAARSWEQWRDEVLDELEIAHPGLRALATQLDVRLLGHAMTRPTPGLVHGVARAAASGERPHGVVHFAHSDLSALPLFEEAVYWGQRVAVEVALAL
ncbi:NAD -binding rossmann-like domain protein [Chrysochromulina tobinii]|uniref:NAD-binding rossmann-like domain protein n=1 Tax=Chrysochromulina tobinii TaxID=1460289 RepID=A0A0M0K8L2_9EUKA|nr:NAD -binding rossmann-like domain protein [Chrysochromulina tobinii]|eukprot:KOO35139.1 NAD -binding rossmann-like domain protein [Chrysochromulina sp. CCMP291]